MPKPGTTVETKTEYVTEEEKRWKQITTTTTIVTETPGGGFKTRTKTAIEKQQLREGEVETEEVTTKIEKLTTDDPDEKEHDKKNNMSSLESKKFRKECLKAINDFRSQHSASDLDERDDLTEKAQKHAIKMLEDNNLSLLSGENLGQSLSMRMPRPSGTDIAKQWYEEKKSYDFQKAEFVRGAGNFTQIIWSESIKIGIGVASNKEGETFVIALFDPAGNVAGRFKENVKKQK